MCSFTWWSIVLIVLLWNRLPLFFSYSFSFHLFIFSSFHLVGGHFSLGCSFHMCDIYFICTVFSVRQSQRSIEKSLYRSFSICCGCVIEKLNETVLYFVSFFLAFAYKIGCRLFVCGSSYRCKQINKQKNCSDLCVEMNCNYQIRYSHSWSLSRCVESHNKFDLVLSNAMQFDYCHDYGPVIRASISTMNAYSFILCVCLCNVKTVSTVSSDIFEWAGSSVRQKNKSPHGYAQRETNERE